MKWTSGLVSLLFIALLSVSGAAPVAAQTEGRGSPPAGQLVWGINVSLAPTWFDPAEASGLLTAFNFYYALHDGLVKPMPGKPDGAQSGGELERLARRPHLRLRAASRREVSQRRSPDRRGREVLLRALSRHLRQGLEGARATGPGRRRPSRALPAQGPLVRLSRLLRHPGHRRGLDRPEEIRREGRRRRLQEGAGG